MHATRTKKLLQNPVQTVFYLWSHWISHPDRIFHDYHASHPLELIQISEPPESCIDESHHYLDQKQSCLIYVPKTCVTLLKSIQKYLGLTHHFNLAWPYVVLYSIPACLIFLYSNLACLIFQFVTSYIPIWYNQLIFINLLDSFSLQ